MLQTSAFLVFLSLAFAGLVLLLGGIILGGGHDIAHDIVHDLQGDHTGASHEQPISIWSVKVIATFIMVFGAAGSIATHLGASSLLASFAGVVSGMVVGYGALTVLRKLYSNQSAPEPSSASVRGSIGVVTTQINPGQLGEVEVSVGIGRRTYLARSRVQNAISQGARIKVVEVIGTEVVVEVA